MDAYESDNHAYEHMRKHGIHRTKKSGPRKGQSIHETVGGKPFKSKAMAKVKLGNFKDSDVGYKITDHKGTVLKHHKGAGRFEMK